ncbi:MAG: hypothetical protein PF569_01915, partial [Candidatus Woesearchaeota archaeon]|nr:hypothetical protein [Candidatus Woesearchaeota archaeon]
SLNDYGTYSHEYLIKLMKIKDDIINSDSEYINSMQKLNREDALLNIRNELNNYYYILFRRL